MPLLIILLQELLQNPDVKMSIFSGEINPKSQGVDLLSTNSHYTSTHTSNSKACCSEHQSPMSQDFYPFDAHGNLTL
jgi:hypothetical protein